MFRTLALAVALSWLAPRAGAAQTDLTLELGASQIGPAADLDAADAQFVIGGLRATVLGPNGSTVYGSVLGGRVLGDSTGGSFVSGLVEGRLREDWTDRWSGSMGFKLFGFGVREPFPYRMLGFEVGPSVTHRTAHTSLEVGVLGGVGTSRVELINRIGVFILCPPAGVCEDDLWRVGGHGELLVGSPTVQVGLSGSTHRSSGDDFHALGGRLVAGGSWGVVELGVDRWSTPVGYETTGGLSVTIPFGRGWSLRGFFGRGDPDPLTLAQPGSGSGGALLGWTFFSTAPGVDTSGALHEVVAYTPSGGRVRLTLDAPSDATVVQVLGDFTVWEPVDMRRDGDRWVAELDVPAGTHHYGFLIDDEWYVPDDAPDVVPDEWGRLSATLVIEGAGP